LRLSIHGVLGKSLLTLISFYTLVHIGARYFLSVTEYGHFATPITPCKLRTEDRLRARDFDEEYGVLLVQTWRQYVATKRADEFNQWRIEPVVQNLESQSFCAVVGLRKEDSRCSFPVIWSGRVSFGRCGQNNTLRQCAESQGFFPKAKTSSSPETLSTTVEDQTEEKFNRFKDWWIVQVVDNLDTH